MQFHGSAGVIGWDKEKQLVHAELMQGTILEVPELSLRLSASRKVTLSVQTVKVEQYLLRVDGQESPPLWLSVELPWRSPPRQVNVWRGAHVWHVGNTSLDSGAAEPVVEFEALPGHEYFIERQCIMSNKAGYGEGGWLCDPGHPYDEL